MEIASSRTSAVAILASLAPTAVSSADVMGIRSVPDQTPISWTFASIASITLWALSVLVAGRSLSAILATMGSAFLATSTATDIRQSATATIYLWPVYPYRLPTSCFFYKRLVGVRRPKLLGYV